MPLLLRFFLLLPILAIAAAMAFQPLDSNAQPIPMYVGTFTKATGSQGIYRFEFDEKTGALTGGELAVAAEHPSFLAVHPGGKFLYAVNETPAGGLSAFAIEPGGKLRELNRQSSLGQGPTHLAIDREGKHLLVANYGGGSLAVLPIDADGKLRAATGFIQNKGRGPNPKRQEAPHVHSVNFDGLAIPHVFACDLGLDRICVYRFDASEGSLTPADPAFVATAPGAGPRHLAFSAQGNFIYGVNELSNTVTVFARDLPRAVLREVQTVSTLPKDFAAPNTAAEIALHPSGKFLYVTNRGHNSVAAFQVDPATGELTAAGFAPTEGRNPRYFGLAPGGRFLLVANQESNSIVTFSIDPDTGGLAKIGSVPCFAPSCLVFIP